MSSIVRGLLIIIYWCFARNVKLMCISIVITVMCARGVSRSLIIIVSMLITVLARRIMAFFIGCLSSLFCFWV